jgi:hypothetical protein
MTPQPESERGRKRHSRKQHPAGSETKPTEQETSLASGPAEGASCGPPLVSIDALLKLADFVEDYMRQHGITQFPQPDHKD